MIRGDRLLFAVGIAGLLSACAGTPTRSLPAAELQNNWIGSTEVSGAVTANGAWWQSFKDPALDELVARVDARNLDLRLAEARVYEARAQRQGADAALLPRLDANADYSRGRSRFAGGDSVFRTNTGIAAVASWEPDVFGRLRNQSRASDAALQASEADRDAVRLTLLSEVARSYIEYRLYRSQQELTDKTAQAQESTLRITRARYGQGVGSRLDLERAINLVATTRAQVPQSQELAESAFHRLVFLTAGTPESLAELLPPTPAATLPDSDALSVLLSPTEVLAQRPDVRAAERRLLAAGASRQAAAALRYPQLNLSALIGLQSQQASELLDDGTRTWSVSAGLLAPLFDFGRIRAAIDVADARQEQAYLNYERSVRSALQEAQTALVLYTQGKVRQTELSRAVEAARAAAGLARRQYAEGVLSQLEVLDAERSLYNSELAWSRATADVSLRLVSLYQTMGVVAPRADTAVAAK